MISSCLCCLATPLAKLPLCKIVHPFIFTSLFILSLLPASGFSVSARLYIRPGWLYFHKIEFALQLAIYSVGERRSTAFKNKVTLFTITALWLGRKLQTVKNEVSLCFICLGVFLSTPHAEMKCLLTASLLFKALLSVAFENFLSSTF